MAENGSKNRVCCVWRLHERGARETHSSGTSPACDDGSSDWTLGIGRYGGCGFMVWSLLGFGLLAAKRHCSVLLQLLLVLSCFFFSVLVVEIGTGTAILMVANQRFMFCEYAL
ncbi:uncharacterized protein G2W53_001210 [Senna tora]|uniref:Uncharacterized protein n=1 Tax=Senna tora TaxID=362788 RepID=A0A835CLA6_9FABA|nr:uncharacterized protein G2W53_001210 [Senna tora]